MIWRQLLLGLQLAEDDDLVDPVEELRPERLAQPPHQPVAESVVGVPVATAETQRGVLADDELRAQVAGHDQHGVLEVAVHRPLSRALG